MATKRKPAPKSHAHRASWKGQLSFGLVSFPVEAFNALDRDRSDIHFHQLHAKCHKRIHYAKVCPMHGEVSNDEIVSGYEYAKDKYVEVDSEELESLRSESERALTIDAFVTPETVDPLYFDGRMYYLAPASKTAEEPYAVILEAMEREKRCGVGQVVFSGKDQIVLLRPLEGVIHMAMLNYEAEIRPASSVVKVLKKPKDIAKQVRLAQTLIEQWSDDKFDFGQYEDTHREAVEKLVKAKMKGKLPAPPEEDAEAPVVLNLMDALKKSMGARSKGRRPAGRHSA